MKLEDFAKLYEQKSKDYRKGAATRMQYVATEVFKYLIAHTPIDTGKARSDWLVNTQRPIYRNGLSFAPGQQGSSAQAVNDEALRQALAVIKKIRRGQSVFITNAGPYIAKLNSPETPSIQEPPYFVQRAAILGRTLAAAKP